MAKTATQKEKGKGLLLDFIGLPVDDARYQVFFMVRYHIVYLEKGCHHFGQNRGRKHFSAYVLGLFGMVAAEGPQAHAVGNGKPGRGLGLYMGTAAQV